MGLADRLLGIHHRQVRLPRVNRIAAAFAELLGPAETLLEVGPGDGLVGRALADTIGARVIGVDVAPQPSTAMAIRSFDGIHLPFEDHAFEVVTLGDVLHHAEDPRALLAECLRVAQRAVAVKDHFRWGSISNGLLTAMDVVGNRSQGVLVRGTYFTPSEWLELVDHAGGVVKAQIWPLDVHSFPIRLVTRSELQFAARIEAKAR